MLYQSIIGSAGFFLIGFTTEADRPSALATVALTTPIWGVLIAAAIGHEALAP